MKLSGRSPRLVAAVVALVVVVAVVATLLGWLDRFWPWLDGFARTPGFGALAAVLAAVVAYLTAVQRLAHDRQALEHDREAEKERRRLEHEAEERRRGAELAAAQRAQRWQMLMWLYDNIDEGDPDTMLRVSRALLRQLRGPFELAMLGALVSQRLGVEGSTEAPDRLAYSVYIPMTKDVRGGFEDLLRRIREWAANEMDDDRLREEANDYPQAGSTGTWRTGSAARSSSGRR